MATITLKNIPDDLYERLKRRAKLHRRSVNSEAIRCLEAAIGPARITVEERLHRLREARPRIAPDAIGPEDIRRAIEDGRP